MAINIHELEKAADRFDDYGKALAKARTMPEKVKEERAIVAERHRKLFRPAAERLLNKPSVETPLTTSVDAVVVVASEATQPDNVSTVEAVATVVVTEGGVIPEILQRDNDLRPIRFLQIGQLASRSVGRIRIADGPSSEEGDATGFLVAPDLLLTNCHVLKTADFAAAASIVFNDEDGLDGNPLETTAFRLQPETLFVNDETLDYAIVHVSPRTSSGTLLSQFGYLRLFRQTGKIDPTQRQAANIIQHPGGGPKKIALRDNYVLEVLPDSVDPEKKEISLFYGTDTLKGSSGAPVLSDQWYVVALHRGGVPETKKIDGTRFVIRRDGSPAVTGDSQHTIKYLTNEGTRVSRIYSSLEEKAATNSHAAAALARISEVASDPRLGPINVRTTPILLPALLPSELGGPEEIIRRRRARFEGAKGYDPTFLGEDFLIPLPGMTSEVERELAPLKDSSETQLKYSNYSVVMNRERRAAFFAAGNLDGRQLWKVQRPDGLPKRPKWSWDPRMDEGFQPDDNIFSVSMQRGHLFKREDAVWGEDEDAMNRADEHSFTIPNATPMIADFNNVEWGDLEDLITRESEAGNKISYFAGPVFRSSDRFFNELRINVPPSERRKGMRIPEAFWKIVAWVKDSKLQAAGFLLLQTDEIERHGPFAEEINFGGYRKVAIREIEQATGLRFPELKRVDAFGN